MLGLPWKFSLQVESFTESESKMIKWQFYAKCLPSFLSIVFCITCQLQSDLQRINIAIDKDRRWLQSLLLVNQLQWKTRENQQESSYTIRENRKQIWNSALKATMKMRKSLSQQQQQVPPQVPHLSPSWYIKWYNTYQEGLSSARNVGNHSNINITWNFIQDLILGKSHCLARTVENHSLHHRTSLRTKRYIRKRGHIPVTSATNPSNLKHKTTLSFVMLQKTPCMRVSRSKMTQESCSHVINVPNIQQPSIHSKFISWHTQEKRPLHVTSVRSPSH